MKRLKSTTQKAPEQSPASGLALLDQRPPEKPFNPNHSVMLEGHLVSSPVRSLSADPSELGFTSSQVCGQNSPFCLRSFLRNRGRGKFLSLFTAPSQPTLAQHTRMLKEERSYGCRMPHQTEVTEPGTLGWKNKREGGIGQRRCLCQGSLQPDVCEQEEAMLPSILEI